MIFVLVRKRKRKTFNKQSLCIGSCSVFQRIEERFRRMTNIARFCAWKNIRVFFSENWKCIVSFLWRKFTSLCIDKKNVVNFTSCVPWRNRWVPSEFPRAFLSHICENRNMLPFSNFLIHSWYISLKTNISHAFIFHFHRRHFIILFKNRNIQTY